MVLGTQGIADSTVNSVLEAAWPRMATTAVTSLQVKAVSDHAARRISQLDEKAYGIHAKDGFG